MASVINTFLGAAFILMVSAADALADISLHIDSIDTPNWNLQDINLTLTPQAAQEAQKLALTIARLKLPKPFNDLSLVNIRCERFSLRNKALLCQKGRAELHSARMQSPAADFSLQIEGSHGSFNITNLQWVGGTLAIIGEQHDGRWRLRIDAKAIDSKGLQTALQPASFELTTGRIGFQLNATGIGTEVQAVDLSTELIKLGGQTGDGRFAAENLALKSTLTATNNKGLWQWQQHLSIKNGALYAEPLYLEAGKQAIVFDAKGYWHPSDKTIGIRSGRYRHGKAALLTGSAIMQYGGGLDITKAELSLHSDNLQQLSAIYLKPLLEQTSWEGVSLDGRLNADFSIKQHELSTLSAELKQLAVRDTRQRITAEGMGGTLYWSNGLAFRKPSRLAWRQLKLGKLPIGPARLEFLAQARRIRLLGKTTLPFLGGTLAINQFSWEAKTRQEPELYFAGYLSNVALEQLTQALNWTPLSGNIDGTIPKVEYRDNTLSLDGEISIAVFDGRVRITNLASSGLFSGYPKLYSELLIENLDLDQLTQKFKFGGITGKLSGFVRRLYLENWQPVSFYAWLGTPDNDDSSHRISQKAVKNIANIGGGMASDLVSRSFLSVFETFGYDKIGLGCYLHNGVCQMMGVDATTSGYRIIKGGGLPRIDVIGYNPRVDWNTLMERLSRISTTDDITIE